MSFTKEILRECSVYSAARNGRIVDAMENVILHALLTDNAKVSAEIDRENTSILVQDAEEVDICVNLLTAMRAEKFTYADAMDWIEFMNTDFLSEMFI